MRKTEIKSDLPIKVQENAARLFQAQVQEIDARTNRLLSCLLILQWIAGICIACWISPLTWAGAKSGIHPHIWLAVFLGGGSIAFPVLLGYLRPRSPLVPYSIAIAQMLFSSLLIHLTGGRLETHFHVFGSLAFLAFYRNWRVLIVASLVAAMDHILRGYYLPQSIYGSGIPGVWRWLEHAAWVIFEDIFLLISIFQGRREMQQMAIRQAQIEAAHELVETAVLERTAELKASEKSLHDAQHIARIGSWERSVGSDIVTWSHEMFRLFRFDPANGVPPVEVAFARIHPDDLELYEGLTAAANQQVNRYELDVRLCFDDGSTTWAHAVGNVECDETGRIIRRYGTLMDITDRKQAELAVARIHARLAMAQQVAQLGSWECDLVNQKITWSGQMYLLLNLDPADGEPDYETSLALFHPEDALRLAECAQRAIEHGDEYDLDLRRACTNGQAMQWYHAIGRPVKDESGRVVQLVGTLTDITERKAIEEAIRESQASLNKAQAMAHVGSWERDYRTNVMSWSDELFRLCGLTPGSIVPSIEALTAYTHPLDRSRAQERMQQSVRDGAGAELELRLVGADGVVRHVFVRTEIMTDEKGAAIGSRGTLTDVTERVKALQQQTKFASLIENSSDFIAMASLDGALISLNSSGRRLVGLERVEEVPTTMLSDFIPSDVWEWMRHDVLPSVMRDDRWEGESLLVNVSTGKVYDMQASFFLIRNPVSHEPMCLATVQRDITEQKWLDAQLQQHVARVQEQNAELEHQQSELASSCERLETANTRLESLAITDGLTGAKNHRAFQERLAEEFKRSDRTLRQFSVILLDVDKFKQYNDSFGHPEGDKVLKQVVQVLHELAREIDFVARYGGEEFVILLPDTGADGAIEAAERFREGIESQEWQLRQITASFGVETVNAGTTTGQHLVDMADKALYASKESGRNCVTHARTFSTSV